MNRFRNTSLAIGLATAVSFIAAQGAYPQGDQKPKERAHTVISAPLPVLDGSHLKATLVEVNYGPGEASPPHSHPCAVIGYVVSGALRTQVEGESEKIVNAGGSFYEPPNGLHRISANASSTEPVKLLAYLVCDKDAPISVAVDPSTHHIGAEK